MKVKIIYVQIDDETVKYYYRFIVNRFSVYIHIKLDYDISVRNT